MHAPMHTCMHASMHASIHPSMHLSIHPSMHACMHTYVHAYIHTYTFTSAFIHACMHPSIHLYIYRSINLIKSIHLYSYTPIHLYIHTYMHAYMVFPWTCWVCLMQIWASIWGCFFWSGPSSAQKNWRETIAALGFLAAGPNRHCNPTTALLAFVPAPRPQVMDWNWLVLLATKLAKLFASKDSEQVAHVRSIMTRSKTRMALMRHHLSNGNSCWTVSSLVFESMIGFCWIIGIVCFGKSQGHYYSYWAAPGSQKGPLLLLCPLPPCEWQRKPLGFTRCENSIWSQVSVCFTRPAVVSLDHFWS